MYTNTYVLIHYFTDQLRSLCTFLVDNCYHILTVKQELNKYMGYLDAVPQSFCSGQIKQKIYPSFQEMRWGCHPSPFPCAILSVYREGGNSGLTCRFSARNISTDHHQHIPCVSWSDILALRLITYAIITCNGLS